MTKEETGIRGGQGEPVGVAASSGSPGAKPKPKGPKDRYGPIKTDGYLRHRALNILGVRKGRYLDGRTIAAKVIPLVPIWEMAEEAEESHEPPQAKITEFPERSYTLWERK